MLTDLNFIQRKKSLGMTFDLVSDYQIAIEAIHAPNLEGGSWEGSSFSSIHDTEDFYRFLQSQGHVLSKWPSVTFQQVFFFSSFQEFPKCEYIPKACNQ